MLIFPKDNAKRYNGYISPERQNSVLAMLIDRDQSP